MTTGSVYVMASRANAKDKDLAGFVEKRGELSKFLEVEIQADRGSGGIFFCLNEHPV